ncbi:MAG TPA: transposase [Pseudomonas sp.]|nr:transposase [Pseudomonadales bacterium]HCB41861.1 transposase [Pseudomonas sp.]HCL40571.1 transposase [Pseudomonas sp.]|tara:strand:+ start:304 stop:1491 length:1188 start_codon:yes stop_codon:yes gene_type:complete
MLKLKLVLDAIEPKQADLARSLQLSKATIAQLINHGLWPKSLDRTELEQRIRDWLLSNGAANDAIGDVFEEVQVDQPCANTADPQPPEAFDQNNQESEPMLKRKQTLMPATRRAFALPRDPFDDLTCADDMYVSQDIRYVRECMYQVARHDGFLAVVGESGAGKSTLRRELVARLEAEDAPVMVIEPYVLASEENDTKGKTLKSTHIAEAITSVVQPLESGKSSPQARFDQMVAALKGSAESGMRHLLILEEAHSLPITTLKHLKRLRELERGFSKLVSIVLIAQPELLTRKLNERNPELREVVQRLQVVELGAIPPAELETFLRFRFGRVGVDLDKVINAEGISAICERLQHNVGNKTLSLLYPLAIGNLMTAAMNLAADLGEPVVTGQIVMEV